MGVNPVQATKFPVHHDSTGIHQGQITNDQKCTTFGSHQGMARKVGVEEQAQGILVCSKNLPQTFCITNTFVKPMLHTLALDESQTLLFALPEYHSVWLVIDEIQRCLSFMNAKACAVSVKTKVCAMPFFDEYPLSGLSFCIPTIVACLAELQTLGDVLNIPSSMLLVHSRIHTEVCCCPS